MFMGLLRSDMQKLLRNIIRGNNASFSASSLRKSCKYTGKNTCRTRKRYCIFFCIANPIFQLKNIYIYFYQSHIDRDPRTHVHDGRLIQSDTFEHGPESVGGAFGFGFGHQEFTVNPVVGQRFTYADMEYYRGHSPDDHNHQYNYLGEK